MSRAPQARWVDSSALARLALLGTSAVGSAALGFLVQFTLARHLEIAEYGHLSSLLAVTSVLAPLTCCGLGWLWFQIYGNEGWAARRWLPASLRALALSSSTTVALLAAYLWFTEREAPVVIAVELVLVLLAQGLADLTSSRLQLEERFGLLAAWQLLIPVGRIVSVAIIVLTGYHSLSVVLLAYAGAATLSMLLSLVSLDQVRRGKMRLAGHGSPTPATGPEPGLGEIVTIAAPFVLMTMFFLIYSQGSVAVVEWLLGPQDAATYTVSFLVLSAVYLAPSIVYTKFLVSKIFRWWAHDRRMFVAAFHVGVAAQLFLGLCAMGFVLLAAPVLMPALFGERYASAVPLIMTLAPAIPIRFVQHSYASAFYSRQHMRRKVAYMGIAALVSILLNILLATQIGLAGAAIAAIGAELSLLLLFFWGTARYIDGIDVWATFRVSVLCESIAYIRAARHREDLPLNASA